MGLAVGSRVSEVGASEGSAAVADIPQPGAPFVNLDVIEPKISPAFSCHGFCMEGLPGGREG